MNFDQVTFHRILIENLEKRCIDLLKYDNPESRRLYRKYQNQLILEYEKRKKYKKELK